METTSTSNEVGFSTGAIARGEVRAGIELNAQLGANIIELSALSENELDSVEAAAGDPAVLGRFNRVSVHGPIKHRQIPESELVARLSALDLPVVMHPDVFESTPAWSRLGANLLVENNDSRKDSGRSALELEVVLNQLPAAGFCLDVSHALDVGGLALVGELTERFAHRLEQIHAGCACGQKLGPKLGPEVIEAVKSVWSILGERRPVILERSTNASLREALRSQLEALR